MCFLQVITTKYDVLCKTNVCYGSIQNKHQHTVWCAISSHISDFSIQANWSVRTCSSTCVWLHNTNASIGSTTAVLRQHNFRQNNTPMRTARQFWWMHASTEFSCCRLLSGIATLYLSYFRHGEIISWHYKIGAVDFLNFIWRSSDRAGRTTA
jgi:hypothetical protein